MRTARAQYTKAEVARRGDQIYEHQIRPKVEEQHRGKIVAIDVETGDYEVGDDELSTADRLVARQPDAQIWFVRAGYRAVHRIGPGSPSSLP